MLHSWKSGVWREHERVTLSTNRRSQFLKDDERGYMCFMRVPGLPLLGIIEDHVNTNKTLNEWE